MPDEWRPDALGCAGNPVIRTPNLDALAARGVRFPSAYAECPVCQPSRISLYTGEYPSGHGLQDNELQPFHERNCPGPDDFPTFPQRLQAAGYYTATVGKHHLAKRDNMDPEKTAAYGFDFVREEIDKQQLCEDRDTPYTRYLRGKGLYEKWCAHHAESTRMRRFDIPGPVARPDCLDPEDTLDAFIGRSACEFVHQQASQRQPFFLWVTFVGPHPPFDGPDAYADAYDPETIPMGPMGWEPTPENRYGEYVRWHIDYQQLDRRDDASFRLMAKYYYARCALVDHAIGRIVRAIADAGLGDHTWILFSSDHGELVGDHGFYGKRVFYRNSVNVPQFVVPPGFGPGRVASGLTQGSDVPATLLDLAGQAPVGQGGMSLLPGVQSPETRLRAIAFSEIASFLMVTDDRCKLVIDERTLEPQVLYDMQADPDERRDFLGDPTYRPVVDEFVERYARPFLAGRRGPVAVPATA